MPIKRLDPPKPTDYQLDKAKRCVVTTHELGFWVWDPMTNSEHIVRSPQICDCMGFCNYGFCSHLTAVLIFKELQKDVSAEQAIEELFGF